MPDSTLPTGTKGLPFPLVPGLRTGTKSGTFSPEILISARSPELEVLWTGTKTPLRSRAWPPVQLAAGAEPITHTVDRRAAA
jgi:hypothetical protein